MIILPNGRVQFNDKYEMNFNLFAEMGLGLNHEGYLYDQDTNALIR